MNGADYQAPYKAAQAAGHHIDCDGYRTEHSVSIERTRYANGSSSFTAVCEECGPLHIGSYGDERAVRRLFGAHARGVACDGRCKDWR